MRKLGHEISGRPEEGKSERAAEEIWREGVSPLDRPLRKLIQKLAAGGRRTQPQPPARAEISEEARR